MVITYSKACQSRQAFFISEKMKYKLKSYSQRLLADTLTPVSVYLRLRDKYPHSLLLESSDYRANDNIVDQGLVGMGAEDLIDVAVYNNLHFKSLEQHGVAFHMMGPLSQYGKLGITCIGNTHEETESLHDRTLEVLRKEATPEGRAERLRFYMVAPQNHLDPNL